MTILFTLLGFALLVGTMLDVAATTLSIEGGGPVTAPLLGWLWRRIRRQRWGRALVWAGPFFLLLMVLVWTLGLLFGWFLVFSGDPTSLVDVRNLEPAEWVGRMYFVGYTLFTLGLGDLVPASPWLRINTVLVVADGLLTVSLTIGYLVAVISAATYRSRIALVVTGLGGTPRRILQGAWDGRSLASLTPFLIQLVPMIAHVQQLYMAYPVLHFFRAREVRSSFAVRLAALDEVLVLISTAIPPDRRPDPVAMRAVEVMIGELAQSVQANFRLEACPPPPVPDVATLVNTGIGVLPPPDAFAAFAARRSLMRSVVEGDGWGWEQVTGEPCGGVGC